MWFYSFIHTKCNRYYFAGKHVLAFLFCKYIIALHWWLAKALKWKISLSCCNATAVCAYIDIKRMIHQWINLQLILGLNIFCNRYETATIAAYADIFINRFEPIIVFESFQFLNISFN